ncbi:MAG TPA: hypothetical protein PK735_00280 [Flavobacteriales bacterium]|nr:hypothetical protein [Flavobacteriales bacterium]MBK7297135.1 hypothetical protein [Flavobacteriales bacterium]MBK9535599.1 hypothetical protein [Flavobacteriales bacterium]HQV53580.1 hypothetical protein [Flavobacteriales bacterium]HQX31424.1 hypothetical protein [Flavobacteriales bacterium]
MKLLKSNLIMASLVAGSFLVVSCNNTPAEQRDEMNDKVEKIEDKAIDATTARDWQAERTEIMNDLRDLRTKVDNKLAEVNEDLANTDIKPSVKADKEAMKAELTKELNMLDEKIGNVENATADAWDMTKSDAENTSKEVKSWWETQKEKVDAETDADHDKDGH